MDFFRKLLQIWAVPKILSMELLEGRAQLKMENCLFNLSGMSFRPPPGCIIAAINCMSTMVVKSPGFSRLYMPLISIICRVISLVTYLSKWHQYNLNNYDYYVMRILYVLDLKSDTWSPHSFMIGMFTSSMKQVIRRPPGGPYVLPIRLSTKLSTVL